MVFILTFVFVGPFCGTTSPGQFTIPSSHVVIEFSSDADTSFQGFKLNWKVVGNVTFIYCKPLGNG